MDPTVVVTSFSKLSNWRMTTVTSRANLRWNLWAVSSWSADCGDRPTENNLHILYQITTLPINATASKTFTNLSRMLRCRQSHRDKSIIIVEQICRLQLHATFCLRQVETCKRSHQFWLGALVERFWFAQFVYRSQGGHCCEIERIDSFRTGYQVSTAPNTPDWTDDISGKHHHSFPANNGNCFIDRARNFVVDGICKQFSKISLLKINTLKWKI